MTSVVDMDHRSAYMLRDAARLARDHTGMAYRVEQRGLTVVDMAHDRDHGRPRFQILFAVVVHHGVFFFRGNDAHLATHVIGYKLYEIV